MGPTFTEALRDPLMASGPETSPTFYFGVDTGSKLYRLRKLSGPMNASATLSWATGSGTDTLEDVGLHGAQFYWPLVFGVDPGNPMRLYAADDATQQMKYSNNGGNTWSVDAELTDLVTNQGEFGWNPFGGAHVQPTVISYDPADPQRILVGTMHAGVVMTIDGGANWFTVNDTLNRVSWVNSFFFDEDHDIIYASTYGRGLWAIEITDVPPVALCTNVTVPTDPGICSADASIDDGSYDPDGGAVTLVQNPPGPYPLGATAVTLTVTDTAGYSDSCTATVTVLDVEPPAITCPADVTIECDEATDPSNTGAAVATDNCDPGPTIGFSDTVTPGACPQEFTIGRTWTATDASGNLSSCPQTIEVVDTTAPTLGVVLDPDVLWPPNHKFWTITATITAADNCDVDPAVTLVSITSNEPDNSIGDGSTTNDVRDADIGTDDREFQLRAERRGGSDGRVYTVTYLAEDDCGNSTETSAEVRVPHDQSGTAFTWSGFATDGTGLDPNATQWSLLIPSSDELDATGIDTARAYVGNYLGVQTPVDIAVVDYQQDGLLDLIVVYDAQETRDLLVLSRNRELGLHYQAPDGTDYSIPDVMVLVAPDPAPPLLQASGEAGARETGSEVMADPQ
jgi:hypothetical protein